VRSEVKLVERGSRNCAGNTGDSRSGAATGCEEDAEEDGWLATFILTKSKSKVLNFATIKILHGLSYSLFKLVIMAKCSPGTENQ